MSWPGRRKFCARHARPDASNKNLETLPGSVLILRHSMAADKFHYGLTDPQTSHLAAARLAKM
ncbi:MAG: hypothetical protein CL799_10450 [Chromatiales bacterium]|nr:hypothetical protein [Chromatiales bacterium]MDP7094516.1 hypothetical protein [Gammaproteobacteria bacterium]